MKVLAILFLLSVVTVDTEPRAPDSFVCEIIRGYVALYGEAAASIWAKRHRWSKKRIEAARECLSK